MALREAMQPTGWEKSLDDSELPQSNVGLVDDVADESIGVRDPVPTSEESSAQSYPRCGSPRIGSDVWSEDMVASRGVVEVDAV